MKPKKETLVLLDKEIEPTTKVLEAVLSPELFSLYQQVMHILTNECKLEPQWRYYNDGKTWLCKVVHKKKTILWLSVWEHCIKTAFYFTEKTGSSVHELTIDPKIKTAFKGAKPIGKLIPLTLDLNQQKQLTDFKELVQYKKELK